MPNVIRRDPDCRFPYVSSWNATIEREWRGVAVLSGSYVGSSGSGLSDITRQNGLGSGRYVGRAGERLQPNYLFFLSVQKLGHSHNTALQLKVDRRGICSLGIRFGAKST